jgi:hypothetical protein
VAHYSVLGPGRDQRQGQSERFEYQRAHSHVSNADASHVAMISHPDLVARLIPDAARATS